MQKTLSFNALLRMTARANQTKHYAASLPQFNAKRCYNILRLETANLSISKILFSFTYQLFAFKMFPWANFVILIIKSQLHCLLSSNIFA